MIKNIRKDIIEKDIQKISLKRIIYKDIMKRDIRMISLKMIIRNDIIERIIYGCIMMMIKYLEYLKMKLTSKFHFYVHELIKH